LGRFAGTLIGTLRHLANSCDGSNRPDCPIIEELEAGAPVCGARRQRNPHHGSTLDSFLKEEGIHRPARKAVKKGNGRAKTNKALRPRA
jgi:hypothetical protein